MIPKTFECHFVCINKFIRYPDKEAGQIPLAYVVRKAGSSISENQVMDFVAGQVCLQHFSTIATFFFFRCLIVGTWSEMFSSFSQFTFPLGDFTSPTFPVESIF